MKKCHHLNLTIGEEATAMHTIEIRSGKYVSDDFETPKVNGVYRIECHDCGLKKEYGKHTKLPQWVDKFLWMASE